jgi:hypothetical protein
MDFTKEDIHIYNLDDATTDTITLSSLGASQATYSLDPGYGAVPSASITIGSGITNGNLSNISLTSPQVYTTNGTSGGFTWANLSEPPSGKLTLQGPNADIEVNGESLMEMLHRIEERLNILTPNKELEAEWDQLRELGEQYRVLEKKLSEQGKMWETLKKMPPPDIK